MESDFEMDSLQEENEKQVTVNVEITTDDYRRILFWYHKKRLIIISIWLVIIGIPVILAFLVLPFSKSSQNIFTANYFPLIIPVLLPALILGLLLFSIWKQSKNIVKTTEPTKFIFTKNGLEAISKSTTVQSLWSSFQKIQETKTDFILFPQKNIFYPIPKRFFQNEMQINELRQFIRNSSIENVKLLT